MKRQTFQHPELRDANDNIIQQGAFGKNTALANATNDGWIDYVANDLEALHDAQTAADTSISTETLTVSGKTTTGTLDAGDTTVSGSITTTGLTVTGATSVPTANEGDSSKTIANTEFVTAKAGNYLPLSGGTVTGVVNGVTPPNGDNSKKLATTEFVTAKAGNYLPLSGGTLTGVVNGVTPPNGDNSKKLATTEFVTAKAGNYLPLTGGTMTGSIQYVNNGKVFAIGRTGTGTVGLGWSYNNREGARLELGSTDYSTPGEFMLFARDANNTCSLTGKPGGSLTWGNKEIATTVVGAVVAFAGSTTPQGWLLCDGSAVSRTDYAALYAVIGTTYGAGNGSTTFNLPNLVNRMAVGSGSSYAIAATGGEASHKLAINELPPESPYGIQSVYQDGGLKTASAGNNGPYAGRIVVCGGTECKGVVSYGGNQPHNNMPPYLALQYIIKY